MQMVLGYWGMSDILHGYLLARRRVFENMKLGRIADGYDLENTMMAEFRRMRTSFAIVPSPSHYGAEQSKIDVKKQIPKTLVTMGRLLVRRCREAQGAERIGPMLVAAALPTAGLTLLPALVHMRLTSPVVQRLKLRQYGRE
jgi:hypothetical protein